MQELPAPTAPDLDIPTPDLDPSPLPVDEQLPVDDQDQDEDRELSTAEVENVRAHLDGLMLAAATAGAAAFPEPLQPAYVESFLGNTYLRTGLRMTGVGEVLNDLMPPAGKGENGQIQSGPPAAVKKLHPLVRAGLGVAVLALGVLVHGKQFAKAHGYPAETHSGGAGAGAAGGVRGNSGAPAAGAGRDHNNGAG